MPELVECLAHGILIQKLFTDNANADWQLRKIWADATGVEMSASPEGTRAREGYVYTLDHTSTIQRGNANSQTPVWPPMWSMQAPPDSQNSAVQPTPTSTTKNQSKAFKKRKTRSKTRTTRKKMAQRKNTSSASSNEEKIEDPADSKVSENEDMVPPVERIDWMPDIDGPSAATSNHIELNLSQPQSFPDIQSLKLKGVYYTYRALVLDLDGLWLQVHYLTHTSVQLYRKDQWDKAIASVHQAIRGFKVGMALEFGDFVLAFVTNDLVFQPLWGFTRQDLPAPPIDAYEDRAGFIRAVIRWRLQRRASNHTNRKGLVIEAIRDAEDVFPGVGVYTINELCFIAGFSPLLTECEVWDNPSRASRFIEAYISWIIRARNELWIKLLKPCIKDGLLAPTTDQRMIYPKWLNIFGKDRAWMPRRLACLVDQHKAKVTAYCSANTLFERSKAIDLFDCFEPTLIEASVSASPEGNLLVLIFEPYNVSGQRYVSTDDGFSEFVEMFRNDGLLRKPTFLPCLCCHYEPMFLPAKEMSKSWRTTYLYKASKAIWSITPNYPENCVDGMMSRNKKEQNFKQDVRDCEDEKKTETFNHRVRNTCQVCVGPLEYCGNARVIKMLPGQAEVSICRGDPTKNSFFVEREMRGINRIKTGAERVGTRKSALTKGKQFKFDERLTQTSKENLVDVGEEEGPVRKKRKYISADLAITLQDTLSTDSTSITCV